jgi:hypothetical protein
MAVVTLYVDGATGNDLNSGSSTGAVKASGAGAATLIADPVVALVADLPDLSTVVVGDTIRLNGRVDGMHSTDVFEITAVDDTLDTVTVSPAPGSSTTGVTWAIGGPFDTIQRAVDVMRSAGGEKVYIKGSVTYSEMVSHSHRLGAIGQWGIVEGYTTTPGDGGVATISGGGVRAKCWETGTPVYVVFKNIRFTAATTIGLDTGDVVRLRHCRADTNGTTGVSISDNGWAHDCYFHNNTSHGFLVTATQMLATCCVFSQNGQSGLRAAAGLVYKCLAVGNALDGFHFLSGAAGPHIVLDCTIDGDNKDSDAGIDFDAANMQEIAVLNTVIYDCTTGVIGPADAGEEHIFSYNNLVNSNTTNYSNFATHSGEQTGAPLFTTEGTDYTPAATSPLIGNGVDLKTGAWVTVAGHATHIGALAPTGSDEPGVVAGDTFNPGWGWE